MTAFLKIFFFFSLILTGRDPVSAAIGAVVSETAAEAMDKPGATHEERQKIAQKARLVGDTVAFLAGRDVASADSAGRTAVENNYLGHSLGLQFARQEIVNDETLSDAEKRQRLAEVDELAQQTVLAAGKGVALGLVGTAAVAAAPAIGQATLATSAYLMSNPTGMKVASLATKGAVTLGTGILAYDYGKTAVNRGFGAAFARMQEDAGLMMSVPSEVFANAAKSAFPSAPKEVTVAKTLVQESRPIVTESVAANRAIIAPPKSQQLEFGFVQEVKQLPKIGENVAETQIVKQRLQNVSQQAYDYAVDSVSNSGLKRTEVGLQAEQKATRWISQWLKREKITGVNFQVQGNTTRPDMVHFDSKTLFDFKLTPKAIRPKQKQGFLTDFPDYEVQYIFGPGEWRENK